MIKTNINNNTEIDWNQYGESRNLERHRLLRKYHQQATDIFINYFKNINIFSSVLDIGCGGGYYLEILRNLGFKSIKGIDTSTPFINKAKEKGLNVEKKSIYDLNSNNSFNIILCCDILEHLDKLEPALRNIHKALNTGGILYVSVPVYDSILEKKERLISKKTKKEQMHKHDKTHINEFSINLLAELLIKNNFKITFKKLFLTKYL